MAEVKKTQSGKVAASSAKQGADKVTKAAGDVFGKMKKHFEPKKVDEWQKKWLAVPENRKKYEKVTDAPEVVGQELSAMANDIINFAQRQEGGKSHVFGKIKSSVGGLFTKASGAVKSGAAQAGKVAGAAKKPAKKVSKGSKK